ncbi:MAG: acyltransferase [Planctomycetota bacterium]|jgi:acetyltransferase-like isoleucine patch superfamily enzyme
MFKSFVHKLLLWLDRQEVRYYRAKMHVGKRVKISRGLRVKNPMNITIGDDVSIGCNVILEAHAPIYIGDLALIASGVKIVTANHNMSKRNITTTPVKIVTANHNMSKRNIITSPVKIGNNCWLGTGVIILPGVTIGDGVTVGAGSVVAKDLPAEMICIGVPAKPLKPQPKS